MDRLSVSIALGFPCRGYEVRLRGVSCAVSPFGVLERLAMTYVRSACAGSYVRSAWLRHPVCASRALIRARPFAST